MYSAGKAALNDLSKPQPLMNLVDLVTGDTFLIYKKVNKRSSQCQQQRYFSVSAVNNMSKIIISLKCCSCYFTARRLAAAKVFGHDFIRQNFERLRWTLTKSVSKLKAKPFRVAVLHTQETSIFLTKQLYLLPLRWFDFC